MPFNSSDIVFVTGANGHVAQHVVQQLLALQAGPGVRASVRSDASAAQLRSQWPEAASSGRLDIVFVKTLEDPRAFDTVLKGVTHIAHVASPLTFAADNVEEQILKPAIEGTKGVLAAAATVPSIRSVVVTGSFVSVADMAHALRPGYTYTTKDWNSITYSEAADPNLDLTRWPEQYRQYITYMASKALSERALWEFQEKEKPKYSLNVVLPTWIGGPYVLPLPEGASKLSASIGLLYGCATGGDIPPTDFPNWIDVRDVAKAHLKALEREDVTGQRILIAGRALHYDEIAEIAAKSALDVKPSTTRYNLDKSKHFAIDNSSIQSIGMSEQELIPVEKMVVDTVQNVLENERKK